MRVVFVFHRCEFLWCAVSDDLGCFKEPFLSQPFDQMKDDWNHGKLLVLALYTVCFGTSHSVNCFEGENTGQHQTGSYKLENNNFGRVVFFFNPLN